MESELYKKLLSAGGLSEVEVENAIEKEVECLKLSCRTGYRTA